VRARTVNAAGTAIAYAGGYVVCMRTSPFSAVPVSMPGGELARAHVPSRSTMIKTAESVHFVYEIPYSCICGLVGTYPTIFDE
jgi:hypothetical protein